jgi:hypothetical protein
MLSAKQFCVRNHEKDDELGDSSLREYSLLTAKFVC